MSPPTNRLRDIPRGDLNQEERLPLGPLDQQALEELQRRIGSEKDVEELLRALGGQGIEAQLRVMRHPRPCPLGQGGDSEATALGEGRPGGR